LECRLRWLRSVLLSRAVVIALAVLLFRALLHRGAPWSALFAFPVAWMTYEWIRNFALPHGTAGSLAYTQLNFLPFLELTSVTGPWGMSLLLLLFPAAVAIGLHLRRAAPKQAFRIAGAGLGLVAIVLIFGAVRLATPLQGSRVAAGLIASDEPGNIDVASECEKKVIRIVAVGMDSDHKKFLEAVGCGVTGYLLKDASSTDIVAAVRAAASGEAVCPSQLCALLFKEVAQIQRRRRV
jgi:hypothetical protein